MEIDFVPIDYSSFDFEGRNFVRLVGRSGEGEKICLVDEYEPSFWTVLDVKAASPEKIEKEIGKISIEKRSRKASVVRTEILKKNFLGKKVGAIRVFTQNHKDLSDLASAVSKLKGVCCCREHDISLITKYIKERGIEPLKFHRVSARVLGEGDLGGLASSLDIHCLKIEKIIFKRENPDFFPNVLAFDIETQTTEVGSGEILLIALYSKNYSKVFSWKHRPSKKYADFFSSEKEMLDAFAKELRKLNPDVLTGYFSDGFDLSFIFSRAKKLGVKLGLGADGSPPYFSRGRIPSGRIFGIVHVDIYRFIRSVFSQYLQSESLGLGEVAGELIGETKKDFDFSRLNKMTGNDWEDFISYNLHDARVTYKLFEKIWPDMQEFSNLIKDPLFDLTRNSMSANVENYVIQNLDRFDEIAEKRPMPNEIAKRRSRPAFEGAFVLEPKPGLYENIVMFDFTSMYASVIVSYNLSKSTFSNGRFLKKKGFFPILLEEIIEHRKAHKREYARNPSGMLRARSNAYKLLANAAYGYQAFFGARYYCYEAAAATARFARENIRSTIKGIEKRGYEVIYSDTDSIAFLRKAASRKKIKELLSEINASLPGIMELDLEDFYSRGIFVSPRSKQGGAKKKYALISEDGRVKIRGFETVRRDWCKLARKVQSKIIGEILRTGSEVSSLKILKKTIDDLKSGGVARAELLIKTQIKKPIRDYVSKGPHVIAAEKMKKKGKSVVPGTIIEYFIGKKNYKKKKISDGVFLPDEDAEYDVDYYLRNQILPAVENIFDVFGLDVSEIIDGDKQMGLSDFN